MTANGAVTLAVIAGGAIPASLNELAKQFEQASGHTLTIRYGTTPVLIEMATTSPFDVGIVPSEVFRNADAKARFVAGPTQDIARVGLGVAVRAGAAKPDIASEAALRQTLLAAHRLSTVPASAGGMQALALFERLGIANEMKAKMHAAPTPGDVVDALKSGDADLGMFLANVFAVADGVDLVGLVPAELLQSVTFTAAVAANAEQADAANAFIAFLQTADSKAVFKAKGMIPS
jgi:molybdate transport system substrate-binding protein